MSAQVTVNYVAKNEKGFTFASSLERKAPYDVRVGAGQVNHARQAPFPLASSHRLIPPPNTTRSENHSTLSIFPSRDP